MHKVCSPSLADQDLDEYTMNIEYIHLEKTVD